MFRKTLRGIAPLGVLLVVLVLATGNVVVARGAIWSFPQGQRAASTTQAGVSPQSARSQVLPRQTPPPGHPTPTPPGKHCPPEKHCPRWTPTPAPHGTPPR